MSEALPNRSSRWLTWTDLRFVLHNSNIVSVILGAAVLFGLPQALLTTSHLCDPAREDVVWMGRLFIAYVACASLTLMMYSLFCPETFKDYPDVAAFVGWRGDKTNLTVDVWMQANKHVNVASRRFVILFALVSSSLFVVFLYFSLQFLTHSLNCIPPNPVPSAVLQHK